MMLALFNIFNLVSYNLYIVVIFDFMWSNIRTGLGPARPKEGTTWFRAGLGYCFYTSCWHGTAQKSFVLYWAEPVWHEARWAWTGLVRPGPIPSTRPPLNEVNLTRVVVS
jgi:hypothetical protein